MRGNPIGRWKKRWLGAVGGIGMAALIGMTGSTGFENFFYTTAVISAGLQRPAAGMAALSEALSQEATPENTDFYPLAPSTGSTTASTGMPTTTDRNSTLIAPSVPSVKRPENKGDGGKIIEQTLSAGNQFVNGVAIRNRSRVSVSLEKEAAAALELTLSQKTGPKVLIIHTHTTENYMLYDAGYYNNEDAQRVQEADKNVCAVGAALADRLNQAGIETVHDTTVHDYPKYSGAYTRSAQTVKKNLEQYPTIQVVIDLHRDCIMQNSTDKIKPTVTIEGQKAAQMMFVMGVADTESSPHPQWRQNLHFSMALQRELHTAHSGLVRPISLTNSRYNQHLSTGYLLVEVGSDGNTLSEAVYSAQLLGEAMAHVLLATQ